MKGEGTIEAGWSAGCEMSRKDWDLPGNDVVIAAFPWLVKPVKAISHYPM